jgi:transposase
LKPAARKQFRARMWAFRGRRKSLSSKQEAELDELFTAIPDLEFPYCFREDVAEIFDTAKDRREAAARLEELRPVVAKAEPELMRFFEMYDRWRDGILAYFDDRETSGPVEGLNTKARVITRRSYGLKLVDSLWNRLIIDVNQATCAVWRTVSELHALARGIQATFRGYYT